MKNFDIEAYVEGKLSATENRTFEKEMAKNEDLAAAVNMHRQLAKDLQNIGLSNTIRAALSEKVPSPVASTKGKWSKWLTATALLILLLIGFFGISKFSQKEKQNPITTPPIEIEENQSLENQNQNQFKPTEPSIPEKRLDQTEKKQDKETKQPVLPENEPIAIADDIPSLAPPLHPSPNLRGNSQDNEAWKEFLDKIWYTEYPISGLVLTKDFAQVDAELLERNFAKAYVRLQRLERKMPQNDTLQLLKGYCLIEMGEGQEALVNFENLEDNHPEWAMYLEWNRGLANLLKGEKEIAKMAFQLISKQEKHPYQQEAKKALALLF